MAKVFTITVPPKLGNKRRERTSDPRYVDGQRLLVEAMKYLAQADPVKNRPARVNATRFDARRANATTLRALLPEVASGT